MLQEEEIYKLIHARNIHFDLLIIEAFFNECFLGFVHKFKAPLIHLCTFGGTHWIGDWVGNPNPYAYVPDPFLEYSDKMNFWERTINTIVGTGWKLGRRYYYLPGQDTIMRRHFNDADLPSVAEIEYSTSLVLLNSHFSLSYPRPLMPNMVQVGGLHVKPPNKVPQVKFKYMVQQRVRITSEHVSDIYRTYPRFYMRSLFDCCYKYVSRVSVGFSDNST
jgi:hypothetical protein